MTRSLLPVLAFAIIAGLAALPAAASDAPTAWEALLAAEPGVVDEAALGPLERRALHAMTPEQARAYAAGADPAGIRLAAGGSLADLLAVGLAGGGEPLAYVPVDRCLAFRTKSTAAGAMAPGEVRGFQVRGTDLRTQGGPATGCGVPATATAALLHFRVVASEFGRPGHLKVWAADAPEPEARMLDFQSRPGHTLFNAVAVVPLCSATAGCPGDFEVKVGGRPAHVRADVSGYFVPAPAGAGGGDADTLDGWDSSELSKVGHGHAGEEIVAGTVAAARIDPALARDAEVLPLVLAGDGTGSGLDADTVDGLDSSELVTASELPAASLNPARVATLRWWEVNQAGNAFAVGGSPRGIAYDGAHLWVTSFGADSLLRLRPSDGAVLSSTPAGDGPWGIAYDGAHLWIAAHGAGKLNKARASDGAPVLSVDVGSQPRAVAFDGRAVWVTCTGDDVVYRVRPSDGAASAHPVGDAPVGVAFDGSHLWVANSGDDTVSRLARDGTVLATYPVGAAPQGVAFDGASIWVANSGDGTVTRLRAADGALLGTHPVGSGPVAVAFDGSSVWVADNLGDTVSRLSVVDGSPLGSWTTGTGSGPLALAFDGARVWVAHSTAGSVGKM